MDEAVRRVLIAAGWYPGRHIAPDDDVRTLSENGYRIWPQLAVFISEYGDLTISFSRNGRDDSAWFVPRRACEWIEHSRVDDYQARVNSSLTPVGYAYHDHMALLAAETGEFFGGYDDYLAHVGTSVDSMLSNLINQSIATVSDPE